MNSITNLNELTDAIHKRYPSLSNRLQDVATFVLDHPKSVAFGTATSIANEAGVHASALIRFANAFGLDGFSSMQLLFKESFMDSRPGYNERMNAVINDQHKLDDELHFLEQINQANHESLSRMNETVSGADFSEAVNLLKIANIIHIQAARRAFPVANFAAYLFGNMGRKTHVFEGVGYMQKSRYSLIDKTDLLLAISFAPYADETRDAMQAAQAAGAKVILISDSTLNPLREYANINLVIKEAEVHSFRSLNASMNLTQALALSTVHAADHQHD